LFNESLDIGLSALREESLDIGNLRRPSSQFYVTAPLEFRVTAVGTKRNSSEIEKAHQHYSRWLAGWKEGVVGVVVVVVVDRGFVGAACIGEVVSVAVCLVACAVWFDRCLQYVEDIGWRKGRRASLCVC
jgi:hypothetical protein